MYEGQLQVKLARSTLVSLACLHTTNLETGLTGFRRLDRFNPDFIRGLIQLPIKTC